MKQVSYIIAMGIRVLIFGLVFSSIVLQPVIKSMVVSEPQAFSWLDVETGSDSSEKENQELEDSKDKKVEILLIREESSENTYLKRGSIFGVHFLKMDITIDTHDPPPEAV